MTDAAAKQPLSNRARVFWGLTLGFVASGVGMSLGVNLKLLAGLLSVAAGLWMLFTLAAWGPKTQEQRTHRKRQAVVGVVSVLLGVAQLVVDERVAWCLLVPACVGIAAAWARVPRSFFESEAAEPRESGRDLGT